ncbi:hypothetical protein ACN47A_13105 [Myxococcus fulvus]
MSGWLCTGTSTSSNFATMVIGTERFRDSVLRLELDGLTFRELPTR